MRPMSSIVSVTIHVALGAAVLLGTAQPGRSTPTPTRPVPIVFPEPVPASQEWREGLTLPRVPSDPDVPVIPLPTTLRQSGAPRAPSPPFSSTSAPSSATATSGREATVWGAPEEAGPEVLTGPQPVYPELLRQAGVQGQVVLQALVDTTGRVLAASISVISATRVGFVAPARQALLATLFRPARVAGRAVPVLVRVPFDFTIRGTGRAR